MSGPYFNGVDSDGLCLPLDRRDNPYLRAHSKSVLRKAIDKLKNRFSPGTISNSAGFAGLHPESLRREQLPGESDEQYERSNIAEDVRKALNWRAVSDLSLRYASGSFQNLLLKEAATELSLGVPLEKVIASILRTDEVRSSNDSNAEHPKHGPTGTYTKALKSFQATRKAPR